MNPEYKKYYQALIKSFGNANYIGCSNLAHILTEYADGVNLNDLYKKLADEKHSTATAVERSIRIYLKAILQDYTLEDISIMLNYAFKPGRQNLIAGEFIPVFKFVVDTSEMSE